MRRNVLKVRKQTEKPQSVPVSAWVSRACCHQHFWPECKFKIQFLWIISTWAYYSLFICQIPANSHILWCVQLERACNGCKYCWCECTEGSKWLFLLVLWHSLSSVCCHAVSSQPLFPGDTYQGSRHCSLMQRKNRNKFLSQVKALIAQLWLIKVTKSRLSQLLILSELEDPCLFCTHAMKTFAPFTPFLPIVCSKVWCCPSVCVFPTSK